jgi:hypothetical protein
LEEEIKRNIDLQQHKHIKFSDYFQYQCQIWPIVTMIGCLIGVFSDHNHIHQQIIKQNNEQNNDVENVISLFFNKSLNSTPQLEQGLFISALLRQVVELIVQVIWGCNCKYNKTKAKELGIKTELFKILMLAFSNFVSSEEEKCLMEEKWKDPFTVTDFINRFIHIHQLLEVDLVKLLCEVFGERTHGSRNRNRVINGYIYILYPYFYNETNMAEKNNNIEQSTNSVVYETIMECKSSTHK